MFSENLKEATRPAHQSLEKIIIHHIKAVQLPADYASLLQLFYGYYHPLELLLDKFLTGAIVPRYLQRRKADSIVHDMVQVSENDRTSLQCGDLPVISNIAGALGALYVLEGSTLGGPVIAKMLFKQAAVPAGQLGFFTGYAANNMQMWMEFIAALNSYADKNETGDSIIRAANETFDKFERWAVMFYRMPAAATGSILLQRN